MVDRQPYWMFQQALQHINRGLSRLDEFVDVEEFKMHKIALRMSGVKQEDLDEKSNMQNEVRKAANSANGIRTERIAASADTPEDTGPKGFRGAPLG